MSGGSGRKMARAKKREEKKELEKKKREEREKKAAQNQKKRRALFARLKKRLCNSPYVFYYSNRGFVPRVELEVAGDPVSVLQRLSAAGITAFDVVKTGGNVRFKIRKKDLRYSIAILDEMCYNFRVGRTFGITRLLAFCLARAGIFIGIGASVALLNIFYSHIWRVEISGNSRVSSEAIMCALSDAGIRSGRKKSDLTGVVPAVCSLGGIADASFEVEGTTLKVYVLESKPYYEHERAEAYSSEYDATVTRVVLRSGTARIKRGDVVKKGQLLADGSAYSTAGELLYTGECDAEVYGSVSLSFTANVGTSYIEYVRTGNSKKRTVFDIFGLRLFKAESPFASYETVASTANYDILLPLYVTSYEFFETAPVRRERDISEVAASFAAQKREELGFSDGFDWSYTVSQKTEGLYSLHLFLSGEALISRPAKAPDVAQGQNDP